jgi:superfamily I DNA/RNA helicase
MLTIGSFHSVANLLLGDKAATPTGGESQDWWDNHHADLLLQNSDSLLQKFDTIIIDEGQDFYPLWFSALESLLIDRDNGRFFVLSDETQAIYAEAPISQSNFATLQLTRNVRNTNKIANMIRHIGGAPAIFGASPGQEVDLYTVGGAKERRKSLAKALSKVCDELRIPPSQTLVLVPHRRDIIDLMSEPAGDFKLSTWDDRDEDHVAIGTIHGTKGLERLAVILVNFDDEPDQQLTYIGASRAVLYLAVIGKMALTSQLTNS